MTAIGAEAVAAVGSAVAACAGAGAGRLMTGVAAPAAAAPCGPREGSSVVRSTKPGVAAILGRPTGWWRGGVGAALLIGRVLAPGPAWRLLRSLFTRDAEDTNLQDELGKLAQR